MFWFFKNKYQIGEGWLPDKPDPRDVKHETVFGAEYLPEKELPKVFSWRDKCPPTPYQNGHNCCVLATQAFIQQFNSKKENKIVELSFRWNYAQTQAFNGDTGGRTFRDAAKLLQGTGMPESFHCPNDVSLNKLDFLKVPDNPELRINASYRKIKNYEFITPTYLNLKNAILRTPIQVGVLVKGDWSAEIIKWQEGDGPGHSICLIGYNDYGKYWEAANFWKSTYDNYIKIDYGYRIEAAITFEDLPDNVAGQVKKMYKLVRSPEKNWEVYAINNGVKRHIANYQTLLLGSLGQDKFWVWKQGDEIPVATPQEWALPEEDELHIDPKG